MPNCLFLHVMKYTQIRVSLETKNVYEIFKISTGPCPREYLCENQNRLSCLGCRADIDTQTDRHTDRHTHTLGSIATYSVKMTEYKNHIK